MSGDRTTDRNADETLSPALVDRQIQEDLELYAWWQHAEATGSFSESFVLIPNDSGLGGVWGFFGEAPIGGQKMPVMGVVQEIFYDHPKLPRGHRQNTAQWVCDQIREFVLHYYLRIEKQVIPQSYPELEHPGLPSFVPDLGWCPPLQALEGFGNRQLCYKLRDGVIGGFPEEQQSAIVDLREIGPVYDWVVMETRIFDFSWTWTLGDSAAEWPTVAVPFPQTLKLALVPQLIENQDHPAPGVLGTYGTGVAFLKTPGWSFMAYGPDKIQPAFEQVKFTVFEDGRIRVRIPWVTNQPSRIFNVPLNPLWWGARLANIASGGLAQRLAGLLPAALRRSVDVPSFDPVMTFIDVANPLTLDWAGDALCISRLQLDKEMLFLHSIENLRTVLSTLPVWKEVRDWLNPAEIPLWVQTGKLA